MELRIDPSHALNGLIAAQEKYRRGIELYGKTAALKLEAKAKKDASWIDRTSNARQTIKGVCGWGGVNASISLTGTGRMTAYGEKLKVGKIENASLSGTSSIFVIAVTGNMSYSPYLEFCNKQKYSVLWPTVNAMQSEIMKGWANMLNGLR